MKKKSFALADIFDNKNNIILLKKVHIKQNNKLNININLNFNPNNNI